MAHASRLALAALAAGLSPAAAQGCSLALVLALDVSASVDTREYRLQTGGLAAALQTPLIADALMGGGGAGPVALAAFEWSGPLAQAPVLDWLVIDSPARLTEAAATIAAHTRQVPPGSTAIGAAIAHAGRLLGRAPACATQAIDISSDGMNNEGPAPRAAAARLPQVTINALVIGGDLILDHAPYVPGDGVLSGWFRANVIQGPGAFVEVADGYEDYEAAMRRKLIRELGLLVIGSAP